MTAVLNAKNLYIISGAMEGGYISGTACADTGVTVVRLKACSRDGTFRQ